MNLKAWAASLLAAAALVPLASKAADDYPTRPIRVMVAFPAGGSADIVGRFVTQKISEQTGWNFIIDNRPGAGGNLAFEITAAAEPDGYTILFSTPGVVINPSLYAKVPYKWDDFKSISLVGEAPLVLLVNPALGIKNMADLKKASVGKPDAIKFASSGNGSSSHLAADVLRTMGAVDYLHVPYKGGGAAMNDTIGGQTDITVQPISESLAFIRSGKLLALGQTGATRSPIAPDIPTMADQGIAGYAVSTWYVVLAPNKTPPAIIEKLHAAVERALKTPELQDKLKGAGVAVIDGGPAQTTTFMKREYDKWSTAIKASGTRIE